jgi:hypothetical protein
VLLGFSLATVADAPISGGAQSESGPPRSIRITSVTSFAGCWPAQLRPWSPRGTLFALDGREGISVLDAAHPATPPRQLVGGRCYVVWAPDGRWLAALVRSPAPRIERELIVVTPATGSERDTLFDGRSAWPCIWACDGNIYYWDDEHPDNQHALQPPKAWRSQNPGPFFSRAELVLRTSPGISPPRLWRFKPCSDSGVTLAPIPALDSLAGSGNVLAYDEFTDGKRFLIHGPAAYWNSGGLVVDEHGSILDSLGRGVYWTAVSGDGPLGRGAANR